MNHDFNLVSLIVLVGILVSGLLVINYFNRKEMKRLKKLEDDRYPSATRRVIDSLLDEHERHLS